MRKIVSSLLLACSYSTLAFSQVHGPVPLPQPSPVPSDSVIYEWHYVCPKGQSCGFEVPDVIDTQIVDVVAVLAAMQVDDEKTPVYAFWITDDRQNKTFFLTQNEDEFHFRIDNATLDYAGPIGSSR